MRKANFEIRLPEFDYRWLQTKAAGRGLANASELVRASVAKVQNPQVLVTAFNLMLAHDAVPLQDGESKVTAFRLPVTHIETLESYAAKLSTTPSGLLRFIILATCRDIL